MPSSILGQADAGIYYAAEDGFALANAILRLKGNPEDAREMGRRGAQFAATHLSRTTQSELMVSFLTELVAGTNDR